MSDKIEKRDLASVLASFPEEERTARMLAALEIRGPIIPVDGIDEQEEEEDGIPEDYSPEQDDDVVGMMIEDVSDAEKREAPDPALLARLQKKKGMVIPSLRNLVEILEGDPRMKGTFVDDTFAHVVRWRGQEMTDAMETEVNLWITSVYGIQEVATTKVREAIICVATRHPSHPIRDWLESLRWDGQPRLNMWMSRGLGAIGPIYEKIGRMWMISAVARAIEPGCKVDTTLILHGEQGAGKSSVFRALVPNQRWFSDTSIDIHSKDGRDALVGIWIYELAELDSVRKSETTAVKAFLSAQDDRFRPAYGRNKVRYERQCVIVGSTNEDEFLNDPTGARRFWPVHVTTIDLKGIAWNRDQLWAEAVAAFHSGEKWHFNRGEDTAALSEIWNQYQLTDIWEDPVAEWIQGRGRVQTSDILSSCIKVPIEKQAHHEKMRIGNILRKLGWTRKKVRTKFWYFEPGWMGRDDDE
ncbi:MAG: virulence-associated E family protein [Thermoleophilia bacterium]